jgi:hypothetical protein
MKRNPMPPRKAPLGRSVPPRQVRAKRAVPRALPARRDTGPSRKVRALVMAREGNCCAACGISVIGRPYSVQHRVARGMGGTSSPAANSPERLVLLCGSATTPGSCHALCEARDPDMHGRGFWLWSWEDPALIPVMLASEHGSGITVRLTAGGTYSAEPPEGLAA